MAEAAEEGVRVRAVARYVRISPYKARQVADLIRGQGLEEARYITTFSTKGAGRGLGTYMLRFLTEQYLGGSAEFSSSEKDGTTFRIRIPLKPA